MIKEEKFLLNKNTGEEIDIKQSDFEFVQQDSKIHDTKFKSKATTFFKDSIKRFCKSKSAITGGAIVGILVLMAIIVPMCTENVGAFNVDRLSVGGQTVEKNIQPKLFPAGTGFWDGTLRKTNVVYDEVNQVPQGFREGVFSDLVTYSRQVDTASPYGKNGYVAVFCADTRLNGNFYSPFIDFDLDNFEYTIDVTTLDEQYLTYLKSSYRIVLQSQDGTVYPLTDFATNLSSSVNVNDAIESLGIAEIYKTTLAEDEVVDEDLPSEGEEVPGEGEENPGEDTPVTPEEPSEPVGLYARVQIEVEAQSGGIGCVILDNVNISTNNPNQEDTLKSISFDSGNEVLTRAADAANAWNSTSGKNAYKVDYTYCDFTYDQYEDVYGNQEKTLSSTSLIGYQAQGDIRINLSADHAYATTDKAELAERFPILNTEDGLIVEVVEQIGDAEYNASRNRWDNYSLRCVVRGYKYLGYDSVPVFLFGTNSDCRDYFKLIFTSMRFSFLLAIGVSAVNIIIGLVWGSVSGYFGGWTDIIMERIVEIVGSLPLTVVITLCIMYGNQFNWGSMSDVIALMVALFLTGWMGVASRTRTQFYRFKGREYVLASRTLGAKDTRLIFRHILPNSMGTIITGSILMIPSVIYTEASIAYLGLGLSGQNMFGVILSEANSNYMGDTTYILIIPTFFMALLLVSFNLFGNGLRDAFNPQLKGGDM